MPTTDRTPVLIPLVALAFALAHLAYEHLTGGVQSHHLLARPDLPLISNWFGLVTLPLLGFAVAWRTRAFPRPSGFPGLPPWMLAALAGALLYGVVLATSFELGASQVTLVMFIGLFVCALVLPVYRAEYLLGFVLGMTVTFGGVLPLLVALVVALVSFVVRCTVRAIATLARKGRTPAEGA